MGKRLNNDESISSKKIIELNENYKTKINHPLSVSKLLEYISHPFDDVGTAERCAKKGENDPNYKYYKMSADEILAAWKAKADESKRYGSLLDDYAGMRLNESKELELWKLDNNFEYDKRLNSNCKGFDEFFEVISTKTNYKYVSREMSLYITSKSGNTIKGRFDCLFYDETTNSYIIIDWKTTDDIPLKNNYGTKLLGPAYTLDECDANKYTLQLQFYKKALSENYSLTSPDKISVYVCNVLKEPDPITGKYYKLIKQNFEYNSELLDQLIDFANNKHKLLNNG